MAQARNTIEYRYPEALQYEIAEWLVDRVPRKEIVERLKARGVAPLPHPNSFTHFVRGPQYGSFRERILGWRQEVADRKQLAQMIRGDGTLEDMWELLTYKAAQELQERIASGSATVNDLAKMLQSVCTAKKTSMQELEQQRRQQIEAIEAEHDAEVAELEARIAKLEGTREGKPGGLSDEALQEIEEKAKLL